MSSEPDWLEKLYIRDFIAFLQDAFTKLFPRINAKLSTTESASPRPPIVLTEAVVASDTAKRGWVTFFKSYFALLGASAFFVSSPLICAYLWRQFRASRLFMREERELSNRGIVVTGCDSGIGLETVMVLSAELPETLIFAGCLTIGSVQKLSALRKQNLIPVRLDVTSDSDVCSFVNVVRSQLGDRKLSAIINNAGVFDGSYAEITPTDAYDRVMQVNFHGVVRVTKSLLPLLAKGEPYKGNGGRIINVSSLAEIICSPGNTAYSASKYAMSAFTDGLRQELKQFGIRVIRIVPGPVRTGSLSQIPVSMNALLSGSPKEVAERYGGQTFVAAYGRFFAELYDTSVPPVRIALAIQKALMRRYPKDIYYEQDRIFYLVGLCPHFVRDYLMDLKSFREQILAKYTKK